MNLDGKIADRLIKLYTAARIPILCVHDSFIVPYDQTLRVRNMMPRVARGIIGHELEVDSKELGLDELDHWPRQRKLDFIRWRQLPRSEGYLERWRLHERGMGDNK